MTEWHPKLTREQLPGRSVHGWDHLLGILTRIGLPSWLVALGSVGAYLVALSRGWSLSASWVWWVLGGIGGLAWLGGGAWIVGTRLLMFHRQKRLQAELAAGYTTSRYAPNFMIRPPEIDHVDGQSGRIVRLAGEPWLTESEYEDRLRTVREANGRGTGAPGMWTS